MTDRPLRSELAPMGFGDLLSLAIRLVQDRFGQLLPAVVVLAAPLHLISALVLEGVADDPEDWERTNRLGETVVDVDGGDVVAFLLTFAASLVISMVATQLATAASLRVLVGSYVDERVGWRDGVRFAMARIGPLIALGLLTLVLTLLATAALIIPGIWAFGAWAVATPVLLLEDRRGMSALNRSWQLVRGRWWAVVGLLIVSTVLAGVLGSVLSGLLSVPLDAMTDSDVVLDAASAIGTALGAVLVAPFAAAVMVVLYVDLRVRKEGFNRVVLAATVGAPPPAPIASQPPPPPPLAPPPPP